MRTLTILFLLFACGAKAQLVSDINLFSSLPYGFSVEAGRYPCGKQHPFGVFAGTTLDLGGHASGSVDLSLYAKGQYFINRYIQPTLQVGIRDFRELQLGAGIRCVLAAGPADLIIEPMWRTRGGMLNFGLRLKI